MLDIKNITRLTITILAPVGLEKTYERVIPIKRESADIITDDITTFL